MNDKMSFFIDMEMHLLEDEIPSEYFNEISENNNLMKNSTFSILTELKKIDQSPKHHPEGSVWNHTMLVVDNAAKVKNESSNPRVFMWSALLHDLGKIPTTKLRKGRITSYDHDREGEALAVNFLKEFSTDTNFINKVAKMVRWHMQPLFVSKKLPFGDIKRMTEEVSINEIALLSLCDRLGRGGMDEEKIEQEKRDIDEFVAECQRALTLQY